MMKRTLLNFLCISSCGFCVATHYYQKLPYTIVKYPKIHSSYPLSSHYHKLSKLSKYRKYSSPVYPIPFTLSPGPPINTQHAYSPTQHFGLDQRPSVSSYGGTQIDHVMGKHSSYGSEEIHDRPDPPLYKEGLRIVDRSGEQPGPESAHERFDQNDSGNDEFHRLRAPVTNVHHGFPEAIPASDIIHDTPDSPMEFQNNIRRRRLNTGAHPIFDDSLQSDFSRSTGPNTPVTRMPQDLPLLNARNNPDDLMVPTFITSILRNVVTSSKSTRAKTSTNSSVVSNEGTDLKGTPISISRASTESSEETQESSTSTMIQDVLLRVDSVPDPTKIKSNQEFFLGHQATDEPELKKASTHIVEITDRIDHGTPDPIHPDLNLPKEA